MAHKEMIFLRGFAKGNHLYNTMKAITAATKLHEGQTRKSGEPYVNHPMRVTSALVALGIRDDMILATAMLHDAVEDCNITPEGLAREYGIDGTIIENVVALTKTPGYNEERYFDGIRMNPAALIVKIADRCHNISTMMEGFSPEKMRQYVNETEEHILPLCRYGKRYYPEYSDQIFSMKYHIESVLNAVKGFVKALDERCT